MSYTKKTLEELDVLDDFLMNAVTSIWNFERSFAKLFFLCLCREKLKK